MTEPTNRQPPSWTYPSEGSPTMLVEVAERHIRQAERIAEHGPSNYSVSPVDLALRATLTREDLTVDNPVWTLDDVLYARSRPAGLVHVDRDYMALRGRDRNILVRTPLAVAVSVLHFGEGRTLRPFEFDLLSSGYVLEKQT